MPCYVNLPLRWAHKQPAWLDWFAAGRISPELGLDKDALELPDSWHEKTAARLREAELACSVHLPFLGVDPCELDKRAAAASRNSLLRGAELAKLYGAAHMIGHPYYRPPRQGRETDDVSGRWLEAAFLAWPELPRVAGAPLFLENTYETSPQAISVLVSALHKEGARRESVGVCFDVGHWRSFAGRRTAEEFDPWLDAYAGFVLHLHLHDNNGSFDQHFGLGMGDIPLEELFARLAAGNKDATATLEPHTGEAFVASVAWLDSHATEAGRIDWRRPRLEALPFAEIEKNLAI